jgi:preprotein translocase subunit YajC
MFFISEAFAQGADMAMAPDAGEAFIWNLGMIVVLVALFYLLLIRPQQKRFKEHRDMLSALKKGDSVVTGGGLVGTVEKIEGDNVLVDLGSVKVTALRSTLSGKTDEAVLSKPANDAPKSKTKSAAAATATKKAPAKKAAAKKPAAKKAPAAKKTPAKKTAAKKPAAKKATAAKKPAAKKTATKK